MALPLALVALVVLAPVAQLTVWSVQSVSEGLLAPEFGTAARNSLLLASCPSRWWWGRRC